MALTRADPRKQRAPALKKLIEVKPRLGSLVISAWPRKRGRPRNAYVRALNQQFAEARRLSVAAPGSQQNAAIEATKGTGLYPHDLIHKGITAGFVDLLEPGGRVITKSPRTFPRMAFTGARVILDTNQTPSTGVFVPIAWDQADLNAQLIWKPADPTRLTVPPGVTVMRFLGGVALSNIAASQSTLLINVSGIGDVVGASANDVGFQWINVDTGPLPVTPGAAARLFLNIDNARTLRSSPATFFSAEILATI